MKTVTKSYFICDVCGKTSSDKNKIIKCQQSHRQITDECEVIVGFCKSKEFPHLLRVRWPDKEERIYVYNLRDGKG